MCWLNSLAFIFSGLRRKAKNNNVLQNFTNWRINLHLQNCYSDTMCFQLSEYNFNFFFWYIWNQKFLYTFFLLLVLNEIKTTSTKITICHWMRYIRTQFLHIDEKEIQPSSIFFLSLLYWHQLYCSFDFILFNLNYLQLRSFHGN